MSSDEEDFTPDADVGEASTTTLAIKFREDETARDTMLRAIPGVPTRAELRASDPATGPATARISAAISGNRPVHFMPNSITESVNYQGGPRYELNMFGVLEDGSKAHVVIPDIDVFFDVRVPDESEGAEAAKDFDRRIRLTAEAAGARIERIEAVRGNPGHGYREVAASWRRIFFADLRNRKALLLALREKDYETASDDRSSYYRMAARVNGFVYTDWGVLEDYNYFYGGASKTGQASREYNSPLCEHVFRVSARKFRPLVDPMAPKEEGERQAAARKANPDFVRDRLLVATWDIETYDAARTGDVPLASRPACCVFMICLTFHWKDSTEPLLQVCLVDVPTAPDDRWVTVVCGSEDGIIQAFAALLRQLAPDILAGFNDGGYDWPFVLERARQRQMLGAMVDALTALPRGRSRETSDEDAWKWNVGGFNQDYIEVKVGAGEAARVTNLRVPGLIAVDTRVMFMKLFPKAEVGAGTSLNFYLKACKIEPKADMPYTRMWNVYGGAKRDPGTLTEEMRHVAHYCVVDALRCQELLVKRSVLNDAREVSNLSYVNLEDSLYRANGSKVCNVLIARALRRGILFSNIGNEEIEDGKYPGAYVFHPRKGLYPDPKAPGTQSLEDARFAYMKNPSPENKKAVERALKDYNPGRPVTGLDYSSLYPSLIMAYNFSPEKFIKDAAEARRLEALGHRLHHVSFPYNGRVVEGWFVWHNNEDEKYGLYPSILRDLFERRAAMKVPLGKFEGIIEHMDYIDDLVAKRRGSTDEPDLRGSADTDAPALQFSKVLVAELQALEARDAAGEGDRETPTLLEYLREVAREKPADQEAKFRQLYEDYSFEFAAIDSKQKALKVFMNTFYGVAGNAQSSAYLLQLAGGVTSAGQFNIKLVADYVERLGFRIMYGDTDSLYLMAPESVFADVDLKYALGEIDKEAYWSAMVNITMEELGALRDKVNAYLHENNGTKHLKMAYEEVLYPVVLTGKKKYYGIAHVNMPNFRPKKLFIRGIDIIKMGQTDLAKTIGSRIMWASVGLDNTEDLLSITDRVIRDAVENVGQWNFESFIRTDAWKPHKKNISVQTFMARMRIRLADERAENDRRVARGEKRQKALYYIPEPGERFRSVLVRPGDAFTIRGLKRNPKIGDVMEYATVAKALNLPIDVGLYLINYVAGLCARFINFAPQFQAKPPPTDPKAADEHSQKQAKKYLTTLISRLQDADPEVVRRRGLAYKRAWKVAERKCAAIAVEKLGPRAQVLQGSDLDWEIFMSPDRAEVIGRCVGSAVAFVEQADTDDGASDALIPKDRAELFEFAKHFSEAPARRARRGGRDAPRTTHLVNAEFDRREAAARERLARAVPAGSRAARAYLRTLESTVRECREAEHDTDPALRPASDSGTANATDTDLEIDLEIAPEDIAGLEEIQDAWFELAGVILARKSRRAFAQRVEAAKARQMGGARRGRPADIGAVIAAGAARVGAADFDRIAGGRC